MIPVGITFVYIPTIQQSQMNAIIKKSVLPSVPNGQIPKTRRLFCLVPLAQPTDSRMQIDPTIPLTNGLAVRVATILFQSGRGIAVSSQLPLGSYEQIADHLYSRKADIYPPPE